MNGRIVEPDLRRPNHDVLQNQMATDRTTYLMERHKLDRKAKALRKSKSPIGLLPTEIIIMIISLAGRPSIRMPYPWIVFSLVCHHWRLAVLNHALFWKSLVLGTRKDRPPMPLKQFLEFSQNSSLDIMISKKVQMLTIICSLPIASRGRVKTIYIEEPFVDSSVLSKFLSHFPSLEGFFYDTSSFISDVLDPSRIQAPLRAMQIDISNLENLAFPGCFLELRWLRLTYWEGSIFSLLETLQNLPHLEVLILLPRSTWPSSPSSEAINRLRFRKLTALISLDYRVLHLIDAPALSFLIVSGSPAHPQVAMQDGFSHLCGFDLSKIDYISIHNEIDQGFRQRPCITGLQITSDISVDAYPDLNHILSTNVSGVNSIFDEFPTFYPNQFWLISSIPHVDGLPALLPPTITCLNKTPNLEQLVLYLPEHWTWTGTEVQPLLNNLRGAPTIRTLIVLSGPYSWKNICDLLNDGRLCPCLETLSYSANDEGEETMKNSAYIIDHLRVLMAGRSATCLKPLQKIELLGFVTIKPQNLKQAKELGLKISQGKKWTTLEQTNAKKPSSYVSPTQYVRKISVTLRNMLF